MFLNHTFIDINTFFNSFIKFVFENVVSNGCFYFILGDDEYNPVKWKTKFEQYLSERDEKKGNFYPDNCDSAGKYNHCILQILVFISYRHCAANATINVACEFFLGTSNSL